MSQNKTALVTGATSGIGLHLATKLAAEGWQILAVGRDEQKLVKLKSHYGEKAELLITDLTDFKQIAELARQVRQQTIRLDLLANIAGVGIYESLEEILIEDWQASIDLNLNAPFYLTKALISLLKDTPDSLVLNLGSGMGKMPTAGRAAYCASKFALRGLSLSLANEYKEGNPNFVLITLGSTLTSFGPKTIEEKEEEALQGKAYFKPKWVADKLCQIINHQPRLAEYVLYPSEYEKGNWLASQ